MNLNCIIIDDEPLAIRVIENHLKEFKNFSLIGKFNNPVDALPIIENDIVDVIFLDINMSKMNGLAFLRSIPISSYVIITTAYREYAVDSFELDVLDYLVKPIPFNRFMKSINKLNQQIYLRQNAQKTQTDLETFIFLKVDKKLVKIRYQDILYIESLKDYIKVFTIDNSFLVHKSLSSITEELPSKKFIRIHRSYTISLDKVDSVEGNLIEIGNKKITIGRKYISLTRDVILNRE
ncbi:DNA-binding response regulator [Tenacibaculum sp. SZ-18]|uniref:LytR/AlgR family response regulator transcription factor n=1 Tax=Tenacibaculum sp. SZ-18 TaxID=754423 RepID=UPI000C2D4FD0|nr:LytTR family DNA-binding domain-containing protein [Tenacibaculum sp. SZ-18]AUC13881.1 DNA-binding response regulator [Tenacibaculum sp. SZ-18]